MKKLIIMAAMMLLLTGIVSAVDISSCQTISTPGSYELVSDLSNTVTGLPCIDIQSSDVTLDCQGHSITGLGGLNTQAITSGFTASNVVVKNCVINDQRTGIDLGYVNSRAEYNTFSNVDINIVMFGENSVATGNNIAGGLSGIICNPSGTTYSDFTITDNTIVGVSQLGIQIQESASATLKNNQISGSGIVDVQVKPEFVNPRPPFDVFPAGLVTSDSCGNTFTTIDTWNPVFETYLRQMCGTPIASCTTITAPGDYYVTVDLAETMGPCISIEASDVNLDCQGHSVTTECCPGQAVIETITPYNNIKIRNCLIEAGPLTGIGLRHNYGGTLESNTIDGRNRGVEVMADNIKFLQNTITNNNYGIDFMYMSQYNILTDNYVCGNTVDVNLAEGTEGATATGSGNTCDVVNTWPSSGFLSCENACSSGPVYDPVTGLDEVDSACPVLDGVYVGEYNNYDRCVSIVLGDLLHEAGSGKAFQDLYGHPFGYFRSLAAQADITGAAVTDFSGSPNAITIALVALIVAVVALVAKKKN